MTLTEVFAEALKEVTAAGLPEHLEAIAFSRAIDEIITRNVASSGAVIHGNSTNAPMAVSRGSRLQAIASKLSLDTEVVSRVFREDGDSITIDVTSSQLAKSNSGATRELALLVAASRQAAELEDVTLFSTIREVCEIHRKLDKNNFAATVAGMDEIFVVKGSGQQRNVRVSVPGWGKARELVLRLAGVEI